MFRRWNKMFCLCLFLGATPAKGGDSDLFVNGEASDVSSVVEDIVYSLNRRGFRVLGVIDHAENAPEELFLRPTQVILARPPRPAERRLLRRSGTTGIDLTWRVLVYEDEDGKIKTFSNTTGFFMDRHGIKPRISSLRRIGNAIKAFTGFDNGLVTVSSLQNFDDTVDDLIAAIPDAFNIPFIIDYRDTFDGQSDNGSRKRKLPVLIVFGNPNVGTPLMRISQEIGENLPQKFLVWKDGKGGVNITYNDPFALARRHNIQGQDQRLTMIAGALRRFALEGAGRNN